MSQALIWEIGLALSIVVGYAIARSAADGLRKAQDFAHTGFLTLMATWCAFWAIRSALHVFGVAQ